MLIAYYTGGGGNDTGMRDQRTLPPVHMEQSVLSYLESPGQLTPNLRWSLVYGREWNTWKTQNSYSVRKPSLQWLLSTKCISLDRAQQTLHVVSESDPPHGEGSGSETTLHAGTHTAGLVLVRATDRVNNTSFRPQFRQIWIKFFPEARIPATRVSECRSHRALSSDTHFVEIRYCSETYIAILCFPSVPIMTTPLYNRGQCQWFVGLATTRR